MRSKTHGKLGTGVAPHERMEYVRTRWRWLVVAGVVVGIAAGVVYPRECSTARVWVTQSGSQGYRLWEGESLISFEHRNRLICIPDGWEPVGEAELGEQWAAFAPGQTGVLIRSNAFLSKPLGIPGVVLRYPIHTSASDAERYADMALRAFQNVGRLYGGRALGADHTVLVTWGLAPDAHVYPDPGAGRTLIVRGPNDPRGEELLIHAVAHLYNRYAPDGQQYLEMQEPFSAHAFEELEATWAELAYVSDEQRMERLRYLHGIHAALMAKNYAYPTEPPFNDHEAFARIRPSVMVQPGGEYLEFQYGHYVLAPLVMIALDGALAEAGRTERVEDLLIALHTEPYRFMDRVRALVGDARADEVDAWAAGKAMVPWHLVMRGAARY